MVAHCSLRLQKDKNFAGIVAHQNVTRPLLAYNLMRHTLRNMYCYDFRKKIEKNEKFKYAFCHTLAVSKQGERDESV